jgi:hypothetical protein
MTDIIHGLNMVELVGKDRGAHIPRISFKAHRTIALARVSKQVIAGMITRQILNQAPPFGHDSVVTCAAQEPETTQRTSLG